MTLHFEENQPTLSPEQSLAGWRREFCVELLGEGQARVFLRLVEAASLKATELHRGVLFHRISAPFADLSGCITAARPSLEALASTAVKQQPTKENLFAAITYDRRAWEAVVNDVDRWQRRTPAELRR